MQTNEILQQKINEYQKKLQEYQNKKQELEKQMIILEEQFRQHKEKIEQAFGTTDPVKLKEISEQYTKEIEQLEAQINLEV
jgi:L-lysine 2,3-aminomutase